MGELRSFVINPESDTVTQVQLIPPRIYLADANYTEEVMDQCPFIALVNGENKVVLKLSDAVLLNEFCIQLDNADSDKIIAGKKELEDIIKKTADNVYKIYFKHVQSDLIHDLRHLIKLFCEMDYNDDIYTITEFEREVPKES